MLYVAIQRVRALVQHHGDVGAQRLLDLHHALRRETVSAAVDVAAEGDAVLVDVARVGQAEDLVAARVGEDGTVPAHKLVQSAEFADQLMAGAQIEMVGVGQDQVATGFGQVARFQRLDIGQRAHRRKDRRLDGTVGRAEGPQARAAVLSQGGPYE